MQLKCKPNENCTHLNTVSLSVPEGETMSHDYGFKINYNQHNGNSCIMFAVLPEIMAQVNIAMATYMESKCLKLILRQ
jgi:hypothetical protein